MAKGHHHDGADDIRIFLPVYGEIKPSKFNSEKQMQNLVETSLGTLFPGLKLLASEFWIAQNKYRLDTVAFDEKSNTFVVLEYKNKADAGVAGQAIAYLAEMGRYRSDLELEYYKKLGKQKSFNWASMYAIIIAPEFDSYLQTASKELVRLEVHEIKLYENLMVTVRRVGGARQRLPESPPPPPPEDETMERFRRDEVSEKTRQLFDYINNTLKNRFRLAPEPKKHYVKYILSGSIICSVSRGKDRLNLHYNVKTSENVLEVSERIRDVSKVGIDGVGEYETKIKTNQDFEEIIPSIERVIRYYRSR